MTPKVRAVILNFNGGAHVLDAIAALEKTEHPADRLEIVVVDNASTDGSDAEIERRFPKVRVVRSPVNVGFPGNNLAMRDHDADYIALVNNDAFVSPGWLTPLLAELEARPELGAACPKIVFASAFADVEIVAPTFRPPNDGRDLGVRVSSILVDGVDVLRDAQGPAGAWSLESGTTDEPLFGWTSARTAVRVPVPPDQPGPFTVRLRLAAEREKDVHITAGPTSAAVTVGPVPSWTTIEVRGPGYDVINNVGSVITTLAFGADRGYLQRDEGQFDEPAEVFAWCGGGVLLRRRYLDEVGLFDEKFFLYYEDTDLSWRGRAQGWRYRYVPESLIRHMHAASTGEASPIFQHYVERNRLVMLLKNAPWSVVATALYRYARMVAGHTRQLVVRPMLHGHRPRAQLPVRRLRSFAGFLALVPHALRCRRELRRRQVVGDDELLAWMVEW